MLKTTKTKTKTKAHPHLFSSRRYPRVDPGGGERRRGFPLIGHRIERVDSSTGDLTLRLPADDQYSTVVADQPESPTPLGHRRQRRPLVLVGVVAIQTTVVTDDVDDAGAGDAAAVCAGTAVTATCISAAASATSAAAALN